MTYECSVNSSSGFATVWKGSALDCPEKGNSIILLHSQFADGMARKECNNGAIIGQGVSPSEDSINSFTSQLRVTVNSSFYGKTVECAVDDGIMMTTLQRATIEMTKGMI